MNKILKTKYLRLDNKKESDRIIYHFRKYINIIHYYAKEYGKSNSIPIEGPYIAEKKIEKEKLSQILNRYLEHYKYNRIFYYQGVKFYILKK